MCRPARPQAAAQRPAQLELCRIAVPTTPAQTVSWSIPITTTNKTAYMNYEAVCSVTHPVLTYYFSITDGKSDVDQCPVGVQSCLPPMVYSHNLFIEWLNYFHILIQAMLNRKYISMYILRIINMIWSWATAQVVAIHPGKHSHLCTDLYSIRSAEDSKHDLPLLCDRGQ